MTETLDALANPTALETPDDIPEGYVRDRSTGEIRPRKRRGRPSATPPPTAHDPLTRAPDTEPDGKARGKSAKGVPRWKEGVISKGMASLYRRTGRIVKAMDRDIGIAIIESADDCGQAWDEIARVNPRIRAFLLKLITGGSWAGLFWAHAPIFMAVFMKERIRKRIPFGKLINSALEPDENGGSEVSDALGGLNSGDLQQMMGMAQQMMGPLMNQFGASDNADQP